MKPISFRLVTRNLFTEAANSEQTARANMGCPVFQKSLSK